MLIRPATLADAPAIVDLYRRVSVAGGGLARLPEEITDSYVAGFLTGSLARGTALVADANGRVVGELHAYASGLRAFAHVLGDLTVAVTPELQGQGIGRRLFEALLAEVPARHPHIRRVELLARETNVGAIALYEKMGFRREGRLAARIAVDGQLEADIPLAWLVPAAPDLR